MSFFFSFLTEQDLFSRADLAAVRAAQHGPHREITALGLIKQKGWIQKQVSDLVAATLGGVVEGGSASAVGHVHTADVGQQSFSAAHGSVC